MLQKSESLKEISKALATFAIKVESIRKDANNPFFKSQYASLSNIIESTRDALSECGLSVSQFPIGEHSLITILMHESGEWIQSEYTMKPTKNDPQGIGSVITYMRRYALASILNLSIMEDDDANEASQPVAKKEDDREWLNKNTDAFLKVVEYMRGENANIKAVESKYRISKALKEELLSLK
jgi:hypothetical protein